MATTGPGLKKEKFLGSRILQDGSGKSVADGVFEIINSWRIKTRVVALSYDTCSVNTGRNAGQLFILFFYLKLNNNEFS